MFNSSIWDGVFLKIPRPRLKMTCLQLKEQGGYVIINENITGMIWGDAVSCQSIRKKRRAGGISCGAAGSADIDIKICCADKGDVPKIAEIMEETYRQMEHPDWFCTDDEEFLERHIREEGFILKAETEGEIAGFLVVRYPDGAKDNLGSYLNFSEKEKSLVAHMESAAVRSIYRGNGIQKRLMAAGENMLWEKGYRCIMGTAHPDNRYSVNNFLKLGYEIVAEDLKYGGLRRYIFCRRRDSKEERH